MCVEVRKQIECVVSMARLHSVLRGLNLEPRAKGSEQQSPKVIQIFLQIYSLRFCISNCEDVRLLYVRAIVSKITWEKCTQKVLVREPEGKRNIIIKLILKKWCVRI
jgi:hypothetical protein